MIPVAGRPIPIPTPPWAAFAWIIGWNLVLEYLARLHRRGGWSSIQQFPHQHIGRLGAARLRSAPIADRLHAISATGTWFNMPAVALDRLITYVLIVGVEEKSANFTTPW